MVREPQHERTVVNAIETPPTRPEIVEGLRESFSTACLLLILVETLTGSPHLLGQDFIDERLVRLSFLLSGFA